MLRLVFCLLLCSSISFATSNPPNVEFKAITAESLSKNSLTFSDLKGKVVIVDFWASWCEPCKEALPHYNRLYEKYKTQGVVFIGINEDDDVKERDTFLKAHSFSLPIFFDKEKQMAKDFQVVALPTLFVFDRKLKPVILYRGFDDKKPQALEKKIQDLLKARK